MNIERYIKLIHHTYLFNSFSQDEIHTLFKDINCIIKKYNKNSLVYLQNQLCTTIDILLEGRIAIQKIDETGNVLTVASFKLGDIMGGSLAFSNNNEYPMTVIAEIETTLLHIQKNLLLDLCQNNREFLSRYLESLSSKNLILTDKIKFMSLKTIRDKLIEFLDYEYHIQNSKIIELDISKKELADRFGIQRPSLFRELKKMRVEGLIDYDHKNIIILDEGRLF